MGSHHGLGRRLGKGNWSTPDDVLPHYRGDGPHHAAPESWPGMYEQVGEPSPALKRTGNTIIVVGIAFVLIALWVFWRVLRGW